LGNNKADFENKNLFSFIFPLCFGNQIVKIKLATIFFRKINIGTYFKNSVIRLYVLYTFNIHTKFCVNQILFTIRSINLFFIYNLRLQNHAI